jgi:hypothetical protein
MADEIESNGSLKLKLSENKYLGIGGKDMVIVVFILLVGVMSYLRTMTLDRGLGDLKSGQTALTAELREQNKLVAAQTIELEATMESIIQMLLRHDYNMQHEPNQRLPLDMVLPKERK